MTQYKQRVDESNFVTTNVLVPGLRGEAIPIGVYLDPMTEPPLGPIKRINNGRSFRYSPARVRSFTPTKAVTNYYKNGNFVATTAKPFKFKSRQIAEINTRMCS